MMPYRQGGDCRKICVQIREVNIPTYNDIEAWYIPDGLLETPVEVDWVGQLALDGKSLLCTLIE